MKSRALLLLTAFLSSNLSAFALSGGPFGNGQPTGANANGTYSAVISGKNLTGMVQFGVSGSAESNGRFMVFHEGIVSYGTATGLADLASKQISAGLLGVSQLPGETTGASANPVTTSQTITVRASAEGAFEAKMRGFPAQIVFNGKGQLSSAANRGSSSTQTTTVNGVTTTTTFASREQTSFRVRGSRTSNSPYSPINSFAALPARAPATPAPAVATPTPAPAVP